MNPARERSQRRWSIFKSSYGKISAFKRLGRSCSRPSRSAQHHSPSKHKRWNGESAHKSSFLKNPGLRARIRTIASREWEILTHLFRSVSVDQWPVRFAQVFNDLKERVERLLSELIERKIEQRPARLLKRAVALIAIGGLLSRLFVKGVAV